jgi:hypothetical protein
MPRTRIPINGLRYAWLKYSCETRAKLIYNKLRDGNGLGLCEILPGWQDIIYSESEGWLVPWEKALLKGEPVNSAVAKLNRRKGQLRKTTVLNGVEKAASEQKTIDCICLLVNCDSQLRQILQWNQ